jgi:hypothetical protein
MKIVKKKFTASFVLLSMFLMVSGFCFADFSMAAMDPVASGGQMDMTHCSGSGNTINKNVQTSFAIMPCCVDRHDGLGTSLPTIFNEKINFEAAVASQNFYVANLSGEKYLYTSSSGPPLKPDLLSCLIKIE